MAGERLFETSAPRTAARITNRLSSSRRPGAPSRPWRSARPPAAPPAPRRPAPRWPRPSANDHRGRRSGCIRDPAPAAATAPPASARWRAAGPGGAPAGAAPRPPAAAPASPAPPPALRCAGADARATAPPRRRPGRRAGGPRAGRWRGGPAPPDHRRAGGDRRPAAGDRQAPGAPARSSADAGAPAPWCHGRRDGPARPDRCAARSSPRAPAGRGRPPATSRRRGPRADRTGTAPADARAPPARRCSGSSGGLPCADTTKGPSGGPARLAPDWRLGWRASAGTVATTGGIQPAADVRSLGRGRMDNFRIANCNAANFNYPGVRYAGRAGADGAPISPANYDHKVKWLSNLMDTARVDLVGFEALFHQQAIADVVKATPRFAGAQVYAPDLADNVVNGEARGPFCGLVTRFPIVSQAAILQFPADVAGKLMDQKRDADTTAIDVGF